LKAIHELGLRCPEDVALAVFDEVPFGDVIQPRLTVVAQPAYEMAGRHGTADRPFGRQREEPVRFT